jgi:hypothetical protein
MEGIRPNRPNKIRSLLSALRRPLIEVYLVGALNPFVGALFLDDFKGMEKPMRTERANVSGVSNWGQVITREYLFVDLPLKARQPSFNRWMIESTPSKAVGHDSSQGRQKLRHSSLQVVKFSVKLIPVSGDERLGSVSGEKDRKLFFKRTCSVGSFNVDLSLGQEHAAHCKKYRGVQFLQFLPVLHSVIIFQRATLPFESLSTRLL